MQNVLKKEVREDIRTEFAEFDVEDSDLKSLRKEESIQSIIFDEPLIQPLRMRSIVIKQEVCIRNKIKP